MDRPKLGFWTGILVVTKLWFGHALDTKELAQKLWRKSCLALIELQVRSEVSFKCGG